MYTNTTVPIITMLGWLEVKTKILNIYMKTVESNNYRETSGVDKDINGILVTM